MPRIIVKTQRDVAKWLRVRPGTVNQWAKRGLPQLEDGSYDIDEIERWRDATIQRGGDRRPADRRRIPQVQWDGQEEEDPLAGISSAHSLDLDPDNSLARSRNEKTISQRLLNRKMAGELIDRDVYRRAMQSRAVELRRVLEIRRRQLVPRIMTDFALPQEKQRDLMRLVGEADDELIDIYARQQTLPDPALSDDDRALLHEATE